MSGQDHRLVWICLSKLKLFLIDQNSCVLVLFHNPNFSLMMLVELGFVFFQRLTHIKRDNVPNVLCMQIYLF